MAGLKKAVVLLSGGLDSATTLYFAKKNGYKCLGLIFDYGQRHYREITSAKKIARRAGCSWQVIKITLPWKGSSLLDRASRITHQASRTTQAIPSTYVPARNIVFLSFALSFAEAIKAQAIFMGAHTEDYSGYPDCRPEFFRAFAKVIASGTKAGAEKNGISIKTPLINMPKAEIIKLGQSLGVPFELTRSCYQGGKAPCGECDSCYYRAKGFQEAELKDPIVK